MALSIRSNEGINEVSTWIHHTKLSDHDQAEVLSRSAAIMERIPRMAKDRDGMAKDLLAVKRILKPKHLWDKWLKLRCMSKLKISRATAHRIINEHVQRRAMPASPLIAAGILPSPRPKPMAEVRREAMLPPRKPVDSVPRSTSGSDSVTAALRDPGAGANGERTERMVEVGRWRRKLAGEQAAEETFKVWRPRIDLVSPKERGDSVRMLVGAMLAYIGVSHQTIKAEAVPAEWVPKHGMRVMKKTA